MLSRFKKVQSQNLKAVAYDKAQRELHVKFNWTGDKVYVYLQVPEKIYTALMNAESIGRWFHNNVRYRYSEGKTYMDS